MPAPPSSMQPSRSDAPTDKQICLYIAEMCAELRQIAKRPAGLRTLRYLLDMARIESERVGKELPE